ncbi:hypothetical protein ERJ75_001124400 [Trypanosoma vivax]|nr:hypothetical protein ERJ75_001124400 [Trypanosoma vivax]
MREAAALAVSPHAHEAAVFDARSSVRSLLRKCCARPRAGSELPVARRRATHAVAANDTRAPLRAVRQGDARGAASAVPPAPGGVVRHALRSLGTLPRRSRRTRCKPVRQRGQCEARGNTRKGKDMTQRRGNARALCVAALCALWPLAAETAVKQALLQPKAKLLCDVSKASKAVAAAAGKKDATIAALEGAATKHAGPLVRAAAAWHTCAASGAEKCSTLREKSATAGTLAQATDKAAKATALAGQLSAQALGHARRIDDAIRLFAAHSGTTALTGSGSNKGCLVVKNSAAANENIRFANGKSVSGASRGTPVADLAGCEETLAEAESEESSSSLTALVEKVTQAVNKAKDAQLGAGAFGAGDNTNIATTPCDKLTNFAAAATTSPLKDGTEVPIGPWWKMTGAQGGTPALGITLLAPAKHETDIAAMAAIARAADTEKKLSWTRAPPHSANIKAQRPHSATQTARKWH